MSGVNYEDPLYLSGNLPARTQDPFPVTGMVPDDGTSLDSTWVSSLVEVGGPSVRRVTPSLTSRRAKKRVTNVVQVPTVTGSSDPGLSPRGKSVGYNFTRKTQSSSKFFE